VTAPATSTDPLYNNMNPADVSVTNNDNDVAGITVNPTSGLTTTEAGGRATFSAALNNQPPTACSAGLTSTHLTGGTVAPAAPPRQRARRAPRRIRTSCIR